MTNNGTSTVNKCPVEILIRFRVIRIRHSIIRRPVTVTSSVMSVGNKSPKIDIPLFQEHHALYHISCDIIDISIEL